MSAVLSPRTHLVPTGTMGQVLKPVLGTLAFDFDLVDRLKNVHVHEFGTQLLSRVAFACDAYINMAIQRAMTKLRAEDELSGTPRWDSYQAFLSFVSGIAANEQLMAEAGMQTVSLRDTVQKLFNVRTEIHDTLLERIGAKYEIPEITQWMANPRVRRDDAETLAKHAFTNRMIATDMETGVIDADYEKILNESLALKTAAQKQDQLKFDKQRGELSAMMFNALAIRDDVSETKFDGEFFPFMELDIEFQFKLLKGIVDRYVINVLTDMGRDRKITYVVHAAAAKEAQPLLRDTRAALGHSRFNELNAA